MVDDKICWMSALELTEAYAKGKISPVDALEAILERVKRYNPELNAIVTPTETDARAAARKAERDIKAGKSWSFDRGPNHDQGLGLDKGCSHHIRF